MCNDPVDSETLAALLDGTLAGDERARVLARLAKSEHEYEDLLEAAALSAALDGMHTAVTPAPPVALDRVAIVPPMKIEPSSASRLTRANRRARAD